jgi:hypothetical protein
VGGKLGLALSQGFKGSEMLVLWLLVFATLEFPSIFDFYSGTLEPHIQSTLLWLVWRFGLLNYLPELASNHSPPSLSLPSS